jgi:hypothetical protein
MRQFYKVAGLVVEAAPVGECTVDGIRAGWQAGATQFAAEFKKRSDGLRSTSAGHVPKNFADLLCRAS